MPSLSSLSCIALALTFAGPALVPNTADACSCARGARVVVPEPGATGVPLNAEVKILYAGGITTAGTIPVFWSPGDAVPATFETLNTTSVRYLRLRPARPLRPSTEYEALLAIPGLDGGLEVLDGDRSVAQAESFTRFTTGEALDVQAPEVPSLRVVGTAGGGPTLPFAPASSCGTASGIQVEVAPAAGNTEEALFFNVYAGDGLGEGAPDTAVRAGVSFLGHSLCNDTLPLERLGALSVSAVDVAGNESARTAPVEAAGCGCAASPRSALATFAGLGLLGFFGRPRRAGASRKA